MAEVARLSTINTPWMNPQGLYHLIRDRANQLLRHLLRTVNPVLTTEYFAPLDGVILDTLAHALLLDKAQLTEVVCARIRLPGSKTGLGLRTYVLESTYV